VSNRGPLSMALLTSVNGVPWQNLSNSTWANPAPLWGLFTWDTDKASKIYKKLYYCRGTCNALVSRNLTTMKHPIWKDGYIHPRSPQMRLISRISLHENGLLLQCLHLASFSRHYHFWSERDCLRPWEFVHFWW